MVDVDFIKSALRKEIKADRVAAHNNIFAHRRPLKSPAFHADIINVWHSNTEKVVTEAFRSAAKSTIGEEVVTLDGALREYHNCLIIGSTEPRAMERLESVKHELEHNDKLKTILGSQRGEAWTGHKALLRNGTLIQAVGVGQSVRGVKHHQWRPDFLWIDDIEDEESVRTPEACKERLAWLYNTLLPICAKGARVRMTGNRLSSESVIAKVADDPNWVHQKFPIMYQDVTSGVMTPAWPEMYDMDWIEKSRAEAERMGLGDGWQQEYMCEAIASHLKTFKPEHYRVVPQFRTWHPVMAMFDPARTVNKKSAATGKAVGSWIGRKLVIWEATAKMMMPSELIDDLFETDLTYSPVVLGIEEDGLQEWLKEPLRMEQLRRRHMLPHLRPERAPRAKDDFIASMQPYFHAGEVEFATDCPDARKELLSFPAGRKDCINALAYFWRLRPGQPIYESFTVENVEEDIRPSMASTKWLAMNSDGNYTTGVLVQFVQGCLEILRDWIDDREPSQAAHDIIKSAKMEAQGEVQVILPPTEFNQWHNHGLVAAIHKIPKRPSQGQHPDNGRTEIRFLIEHQSRARLNLIVSSRASWTLRAFSGGYAKAIDKRGVIEPLAEKNVYRVLMEGLESMAGIMRNAADEAELDQSYRESRDGRRYKSIIGR